MKKIIAILGLALILVLPVNAATPLGGKIIALDAGHGNGVTGAVGKCDISDTLVNESNVNVAVRIELKAKLITSGAIVHDVAQLSTRKARVADAESANADVLISIHHNGSGDTTVDYTKSFVTQKNDKELAKPIHNAILTALGLDNKGIKSDGYGMTVYGKLPGVLTESYFITNTGAACDFVDYQNGATNTRVQKEAQAMHDGLMEYFTQSGGNGDDGGNGNKGGNGKGKNK